MDALPPVRHSADTETPRSASARTYHVHHIRHAHHIHHTHHTHHTHHNHERHPMGGMPAVVQGLAHYVNLPWLEQHHARIPVLSIFSFICGCISIALMSAVALVLHSPFIFPSLGPTAFLFFYTPTAPSASPRNTIIGHLIGISAGYLSLRWTGLTDAGPALIVGITWSRVIAAGLSLGLCAGLMVLLDAPHPPAGATTLIVSLGILTHPWQLIVLMTAVVMLTAQAFAINRLAGVPYPLWRAPLRTQDVDVNQGEG